MDEELEQPNKISPESFFEQLTAVRETADAAQKTSNSNLNLLNSLKTQVDVISTDFKLFKDEKADEAFEEEDRKQKELMDQRAKAQGEKKGEGTSSEPGEPEEQEKGLLGSIGDFISNFFGGLVGGVAGLAISGVGTLLNFGSSAVQGAKDLGKDIAEKLKGTGDDIKEKGKNILDGIKKTGDDIKEKGKNILGGIKKTFSGIGDTISNFDGTPGSRETKDKPQEVDATNPESSTFSTDIQYTGKLGSGLKFIVDESSLEPGVTPERAEQHYYKEQIDILEDDFRQDIVFRGMSRETAIDVYGPASNLYRFKENYNNTLQYGGYELDVGKHYDFVKKSYSSSNKKDKKDNKLMDFVKGGGVAGFLGRKIFGKKDEEEKGINTYSDGDGEVKGEKKENKLMDFVKGGGVAGFLGRKIFGKKEEEVEDTDEKKFKVTKTKRFGTREEKIAYLEKMIKVDEAKFAKTKNARIKNKIMFAIKRYKTELREMGVEKYKSFGSNVNIDEERAGRESLYESGIVKPVSKTTSSFTIEKTNVEPIIESDNKNAIENLSQSVASVNQNVQVLSTQNQIENRPNNQPQTTVPSSPPQVSPAELKNTMAPIPAINILKMGSEKYLSISGNSVMVAS